MPTNYTPVNTTFPSTVQLPSDGDDVDAASVAAGFQAVANRTQYTHDHVNRVRAIGVAIASHESRTAPAAGDYKKLTYGEGIFVAATSSVTGPHTSNDGVTWTSRSAGQYNAACYSETNGRFLLVGDGGALATSDNGTSYTARTPGGGFVGNFHCCASIGAVYVAAGASGEIQSSTGGTSGWTHRTPASSFAGTWYGATSGNGLFVLVGFASPDVIAIQTSPDGSTWTSRTPSDPNGGVYGAAYGDGVFIVVGLASGSGPSLIMRSTDDCVTWSTITPPSGHVDGYADVAYDDASGVFVAVGPNGQIAISRDGSEGTWRSLSRASFTASLNGVAFGDGTAVLCGNTSTLRQSLAYPWVA